MQDSSGFVASWGLSMKEAWQLPAAGMWRFQRRLRAAPHSRSTVMQDSSGFDPSWTLCMEEARQLPAAGMWRFQIHLRAAPHRHRGSLALPGLVAPAATHRLAAASDMRRIWKRQQVSHVGAQGALSGCCAPWHEQICVANEASLARPRIICWCLTRLGVPARHAQ